MLWGTAVIWRGGGDTGGGLMCVWGAWYGECQGLPDLKSFDPSHFFVSHEEKLRSLVIFLSPEVFQETFWGASWHGLQIPSTPLFDKTRHGGNPPTISNIPSKCPLIMTYSSSSPAIPIKKPLQLLLSPGWQAPFILPVLVSPGCASDVPLPQPHNLVYSLHMHLSLAPNPSPAQFHFFGGVCLPEGRRRPHIPISSSASAESESRSRNEASASAQSVSKTPVLHSTTLKKCSDRRPCNALITKLLYPDISCS